MISLAAQIARFGHIRACSVVYKQRGVSLVVVLLFLIVISILGAAAFQVSTLQEKMTGSTQDRIRAFQAAEVAVNDAIAFLVSNCSSAASQVAGQFGTPGDCERLTPSQAASCDNGLCSPQLPNDNGTVPPDYPYSVRVGPGNLSRLDNPALYAEGRPIPNISNPPRYAIERLGAGERVYQGCSLSVSSDDEPGACRQYRVATRGSGASGLTKVDQQATYVLQKQ